MGNNYIQRKSLVPVISKNQFDFVAEEFLKEFYPEALIKPMPVPIIEIAKNKMGLRIIQDYRLSEDFSVFGQMCFTSGVTPIYDKDEDEFRDIKVRRGTMLIDPDTLNKRNVGCLNNTVAHECLHWYKHRRYHLCEQGASIKVKTMYHRCPVELKNEIFQDEWSDEDWMEWQANGIAPRILMPKNTFNKKAKEFISSYNISTAPSWWLVNDLADFFKVSKQSTQIRLEELNIIKF